MTCLRFINSFFMLFWVSLISWNSAMAAPRAIWIWEKDALRMLEDNAMQQKVETFLQDQRVSTLYLYADEFQDRNILVSEPEKYRKLIAKAHSRGFKVFALLGSIYLRTQEYILPAKHPDAMRMLGNVLNYNITTPDAISRFDGINIDIEPYLLYDWRASRPLRARQYLDLSEAFMRMKIASGMHLPIGPAMPFWYDGIEVKWKGKTQKLNACVQDIYDYVAIMDYRNIAQGPDSMTSLVSNELDYADRIGKKVMIGVETLKTTPEKVTFYGKGNKYFEEQLALAESIFSQHPSFDGFVIHHLESFYTLVNEKNVKLINNLKSA